MVAPEIVLRECCKLCRVKIMRELQIVKAIYTRDVT